MGFRRVVSGMRPTGQLHIGHLAGVVDNWLKLQENADCFFEVADLHSMTDRTDHSELEHNVLEMVTDWLALGIDPEKSTIFVQSHVPEHYEIHTFFSMLATVPRLERSPVYKDFLSENSESPSLGLLGYPVLQTGDVALYKATHVPVGDDQAPHIEISRDLIRRFNSLYGETFPVPEVVLTPTPRLQGTDGNKMSKSKDNYLSPSHQPGKLRERAMQMITDPQKIRKDDPGRPDVCSVYSVHSLYNPDQETVAEECSTGTRGCVECKQELSQTLADRFEEFRERKAELREKPEYIREVLHEGAKSARTTAKNTMREVRQAMKLPLLESYGEP